MLKKYILLLTTIFYCFIYNSNAFSQKFQITIEGYLSGIKVGESIATLELNNSKYSMLVNSTTTGITKLFYPWKQEIKILGQINNNIIEPSFYNISDIRDDNKYGHMHIIYKNGIPIIKSSNPDYKNDTRREKVSKKLLLNSLDPVNSLISLGLLINKSKNCDHEIKIFDGRRRFNLKYSLIEINTDTISCKLNIIRIAGYSKKELKKHPKEGIIILKKISNTHNIYFPIQVKIPLIIGSFFVNLKTNLILQ